MLVTVELDSFGVRQLMLKDPYTRGWRDDDFLWQGCVLLKWEDKSLACCIEAHSDTQDHSSAEQEAWAIWMLKLRSER